jgi:trehalose-6-phosphate synthase
MPLEERRARHQVLFQVISDNDLNSWGEHFLAVLSKSGAPPLHEQLELGPAVAADIA